MPNVNVEPVGFESLSETDKQIVSSLEREQMKEKKEYSPPLQKYRSHKIVQAGKIAEIRTATEINRDAKHGSELMGMGQALLIIANGGTVVCDAPYIQKHSPFIGGYYIVYPDGYKSFSPAEAFESGYTPVD